MYSRRSMTSSTRLFQLSASHPSQRQVRLSSTSMGHMRSSCAVISFAFSGGRSMYSNTPMISASLSKQSDTAFASGVRSSNRRTLAWDKHSPISTERFGETKYPEWKIESWNALTRRLMVMCGSGIARICRVWSSGVSKDEPIPRKMAPHSKYSSDGRMT